MYLEQVLRFDEDGAVDTQTCWTIIVTSAVNWYTKVLDNNFTSAVNWYTNTLDNNDFHCPNLVCSLEHFKCIYN